MSEEAAQQKRDVELRRANRLFFSSTEAECLNAGPADCLAGETIIEGTGKPISWFEENKIAPIVQTLDGPIQAGIPFIKGYDWLYEVGTSDGRSFKATAKHLALTPVGYVFVSSLRCGQFLVGYEPRLPQSNLDTDRSAHVLYDIQPVKIASIRKVRFDKFYDLTVPKAHHYFAQGLIHHNTGKTYSGCLKIHTACSRIPGVQALLVRKNQVSLTGTIVKTFQRVIKGTAVRTYGGETPTRFIYPNGSTVWLGGMDNPDSCLSAERDYIYCNQAEELTLNDWEMLTTRCSGRSAVVKNAQMLGDANPAGAKHWIRERAKEGKLRMLVSQHFDNPELYDIVGGKLMYDAGQREWILSPGAQFQITEEGVKRLGVLENLSGVRRKRLLQGIWATAEGAVYDMFDVEIHRLTRDPREFTNWFLSVDRGYTDPAVVLLVGQDYDKRLHIFREFYKRGILETDIVSMCKEWFDEKQCESCVVDDSAAELIASLIAAGVNAEGAKKGRIMDGVPLVQNRLKVQIRDKSSRFPKGRPRLTVEPTCIETINEFESYIFKKDKDMPEDKDNHSMDAIRYLVGHVEHGTGTFGNSSSIHIPQTAGPRFVTTRTFVPRGSS